MAKLWIPNTVKPLRIDRYGFERDQTISTA